MIPRRSGRRRRHYRTSDSSSDARNAAHVLAGRSTCILLRDAVCRAERLRVTSTPKLLHHILMLHRHSTRRPALLLIGGLLVTSSACAALSGSTYPESSPARAAQDTPERFVSEDLPPGAAATDTLPMSGCRNPLLDPRDGTRLHMLNAQTRVGDYEVPAGRYGVGRGEALRIECNTGRVLGIVPIRG